MVKRLGFHLNAGSCTGCKACQIACKDKNNLPPGILWRCVVEVSGGDWVKRGEAWVNHSFTYFLSVACMHCERPICVEVCPTQAIHQREDGIVLIDPKRCMGCHYCEWACPYSAPQFDPAQGVMTKCDFCRDELMQEGVPACVAACPTRALQVGEYEDLLARYGSDLVMAPLPRTDLTEPNFVLSPHTQARSVCTQSGRIHNPEEVKDA